MTLQLSPNVAEKVEVGGKDCLISQDVFVVAVSDPKNVRRYVAYEGFRTRFFAVGTQPVSVLTPFHEAIND